MAQPGQTDITILDLIPGVKAKLQNRADVNENNPNFAMRPSYWIKESLREITGKYRFEQLQTTGPQVFLTPNQNTYPVSMFLNPGDDYTFHDSFPVFYNPPTNTVAYPLRYKVIQAMETVLNIPAGIPFYFSRQGSNFLIAPPPNQAYMSFLRYQRRHPFNENLPSSPVFVDDTWRDVIEYAAAERGAIAIRWNDQATFIHSVLFGDPEYAVSDGLRGRPGLIAAKLLQIDRDQAMDSRQIGVRVEKYGR